MKKKIIFVLVCAMIASLMLPMNASAASGITDIPEFDALNDGDGQYIKYSDNYHLDLKKVGIMDKDKEMVNTVANFFFGIFKEFSYLTVVLFYYCFSFDVSEIFGGQLFNIQVTLRHIFFDGGIFLIVFATSAFYIINQLLKGNLQGILSEALKVIAILVISLEVASQSATFLHFVNTTAKQIAVEALGGISGQSLSSNDDSSLKTYAADAAGMLWSGMVHKPWVALEFGNDYTGDVEENAKDLLSLDINSDSRKDLVKSLNRDEGLFEEDVGGERLLSAFFMAAPIMVKCVFYIIIAGLQMFFQVFTLFYVILCPLILLLAVSPQLGGTELIWFWLKKVVETQLSILILTFVIGLIVKYDQVLSSGNMGGWLIGLWLQVFVMVALVLNWQKVLVLMTRATRSIQNPRLALAMRQMRQGGGMYVNTIAGAVHGTQQLGGLATAAGLGAVGMASSAGAALSSVFSGAWDDLAENYTSKSNYNNVAQYTPRTPPPTPPLSPPPGSPAPTNISNSNGRVNAVASESQNKVIDYNKIPRYQNNHRSAEPVQQPVNYRVAANGEDLQGASRSAANVASSASTTTQNLYTDRTDNLRESLLYGSNNDFHDTLNRTADVRSTVNYSANTPAFKPKEQASAGATQGLYTSKHTPRDGASTEDAQRPAAVNYSARTQSYTPRTETPAEAPQKPNEAAGYKKQPKEAAQAQTSVGATQGLYTPNNSVNTSRSPRAGTPTDDAQRHAAVNYNSRTQSYTPRAETPVETPQKPRAAGHSQDPGKGAAQAQSPAKSPQKSAKEKPAPQQPINPNPAGRNAAKSADVRQFVPKPVVKDFEFNPQKSAQGAQDKSGLYGSRQVKEPTVKPKQAVERFNFKVYTPKK